MAVGMAWPHTALAAKSSRKAASGASAIPVTHHLMKEVDGIKIFDRDSWVLVLPDSVEPLFHIYAESPEAEESRALVGSYVKKIEALRALA